MSNTLNCYKDDAYSIAADLMEMNPEATQDELQEWADERIHEEADNAVIYYSEAYKIVDAASNWQNDIDAAECYLSDIYGDDLYAGCDSIGAVNCRLGYAIVYTQLNDHIYDAVESVWTARQELREACDELADVLTSSANSFANKSRQWFALTDHSDLLPLGDCGDYEAADEIATDAIDGTTANVMWLIDSEIAGTWLETLKKNMEGEQ